MNRNKLLVTLLRDYDMTADEFLSEFATEGLVPCVCKYCGATDELEPDQDAGWCDSCAAPGMVSGLVLMGVI